MTTPDVSIVVVSYNHASVVARCLRSLRDRITTVSKEIILVDNASTEPVVERVRTTIPNVRVLAQEVNHGFARGCNLGASEARGEYLLFVNSDVEVHDDPVASMIDVLRRGPSVGLVGCELTNEDGSHQPTAFRFPSLWLRFLQLSGFKSLLLAMVPGIRRRYALHPSPDFLSGAFLLVRKADFERCAGFDEGYFMYLEDADLAWRLRQAGFACRLVTGHRVVHLGRHYEFSTLGPVTLRMNRGLLRFLAKNRGAAAARAIAMLSMPFLLLRRLWSLVGPSPEPSRRVLQELVDLYWKALIDPQVLDDTRTPERTGSDGRGS
jgi:GT2 family glycosyltransferase